jgi:hypothetical protein
LLRFSVLLQASLYFLRFFHVFGLVSPRKHVDLEKRLRNSRKF